MVAWWWRMVDWLLPARCAGCHRAGSWWCDQCDAQVVVITNPTCPRCKCLTAQGQYCRRCRRYACLTGILAGAHARLPLLAAIKALKYRHVTVLAPVLARYLIIALGRSHLRGQPVIVAVPLHRSRQRQRGHNQAALLAEVVAKASGLPLSSALRRSRATRSQTGLGREQRRVNVKDAFVWKGDSLAGKTILLVDDMVTTSATLDACAAALRQAGARQVWGLVVGQR